MKTTLYSLLFVLLLSSCEEFFDSPIDYFVESPPPSLVVNALLQPGLFPIVEVSHSVPVFGSIEVPGYLSQARVAMFENGSFWDSLQYRLVGPGFADSAYIATKTIIPGNTYSIVVQHQGYTTVQSVTVVPEPLSASNFTWVDYARKKASFTLPALPDGQYYYLRFFSSQELLYFRSNSPILEFDSDAFISFEGTEESFAWAYVRPEIMNGQSQEVVVEFVNPFIGQDDVYLDLFVLEEALYKQERDLSNYDPDNPFSEPTQIHTNVENGYGVFSAYAYTQTQIQ